MEIDGDAVGKPRGFGRAMADLFLELGYDEGQIHPDMFEWLFGLPSLRIQAFLDWFLTSMRPRQSVKRQLGGAQDYAIYKQIVAQGLLTGDSLARAEAACQSDMVMQRVGERDESLDTLASGNARLEREIRAMEKKLQLANRRNERLAGLAQRQVDTTDAQTQRSQRQQDKEHFNEILLKIKPRDHEEHVGGGATPEQLMGRIQSTLRHLTPPAASTTSKALIHTPSSLVELSPMDTVSLMDSSMSSSSELTLREQPRKWKDFLYHHSIEQLQDQEERHLRTLQARIPVISALTPTPRIQSSGEVSQQANRRSDDVLMSPAPTSKRRHQDIPPPPSPWLHESDPAQLNLRDQDTLLYNKCCVELERLRKAFVVGERDALLAQLQVTRYEAHLRQLTSSRRQLVQQFELMSRDAIWARKQILQASLDKTKKQLGELLQDTLPKELDELAFLKSTSILLHSYEQKLWRQENRFVKLRLLLEGFEVQHARLRLVHRLLDSERDDLMQIDDILRQLVDMLRQHNEGTEQRIRSYDTTSGSDAARNAVSQTYLHEQDEVAHRLFEILERLVHHGGEEQITTHSFRLHTFDELVRLCEMKDTNEQRLQETTKRVYDELKWLYDSKRVTLDSLRRELFGDTTSSTPMLLPMELTTALQHASEAKDAAEAGMEKALEMLRLHRRSVQVDPAKRMQQERDILRLQRQLDEKR